MSFRKAALAPAGNVSPALVRDKEFQLLQDALMLLRDPGWVGDRHQIQAARAIIAELQGRVRSRALVRELNQLARDTPVWWRAWRNLPFKRRAIYGPGRSATGDGTGLLYMRHRPEYAYREDCDELDEEGKPVWEMLRSIKKRISDSEAEKHKTGIQALCHQRILRLCIPRGGGKGSLINLLTREAHRERLFPANKDYGPVIDGQTQYAAAFIAHLSFSMEFNSVLRALSRFLAGRIVELQLAPVVEGLDDEEKLDRELSGGSGEAWAAIKTIRKELFETRRQGERLIFCV